MRSIPALVLPSLVLLGGLGGLISAAPPAGAAVPAGFADQFVASVASPTAMAFTPDGRLLVTTQPGQLRVIQSGNLLASPAIDLSAQLCSNSERGLLGVAVDPAFATNGWVFLYYSFKKSPSCDSTTVNRVSRFTMTGNTLAGETVLIDNIPSPAGNHNAGDLKFGKDGNLYISVGDGGCYYANTTLCASSNPASRDRNAPVGKILRIDHNGAIPAGNPFTGTGTARCNNGVAASGTICQETYAWGLRNPFRIAMDPNSATTALNINDVGQSTWEEVDAGTAGADYGWNVREGHCATDSTTDCGPPPAGMTNPIFDYGHGDGCVTITGGAFVPNGVWPSAFDGKYLFADYGCGKIFRLDPNGSGGFTRVDVATGAGSGSFVDLLFGPWRGTQALYYTTYAGGGQVHRITRTAGTLDDYSGDGTTDVAVYRPTAPAAWYVRNGPSVSYGTSSDIPVPGDYDGDGIADIAVYRPSTGTWFMHLTNGRDSAITYGGVGGDVPVPADYDGDGRVDIAIYRPSTGGWYVHRSSGSDTGVTFGGVGGDIAVPADYDGDGKADIAIFRPNGGVWYVHPSSGGADTAFSYGASSDVPVAADYDGDGRADVAVFRKATGTWFEHRSGGSDTAVTYGGIGGDVPVPGTYDGDARADIAIFRPSTGAWYVHNTVAGTDTAVTWGLSSDIPLPIPAAVRLALFS
jgi:glucose/arabinose dehydrogenase